jgi:uncharacterized protein (DUF58 family)
MAESSCFDSDFLKKLEYLSLVSRRVFQGSILAQRRSLRVGSGLEFVDHREYTDADDYRHLDWNLFARQDRLMIKRFEEEQDLNVYLLLDGSSSMGVGSPTKFDYARRVVAAIAYIGLADLDRVSVTAFAGDLGGEFPPSRGKDCVLGLLRFLDGLTLGPTPTDLSRVSAAFASRSRRRGFVMVVSDWFDRAGFRPALDRLRHQGHEVHVVQVYDPAEADPAALGDFELIEVERGTRRKVTINEKALRRYKQLFRDYCDGLREYCRGQGIGCTQTSTATPFDELLLKMMRSAGTIT